LGSKISVEGGNKIQEINKMVFDSEGSMHSWEDKNTKISRERVGRIEKMVEEG
jgi:hypothetical protein